MTDISRLSKLVTGIARGVDLASNTMVVGNIKIGGATNYATWDISAVTGEKVVTMPNAAVDLGQIATNKTHVDGDGSDHSDVAASTTFNSDLGSTDNAKGASKIAIEDANIQFTATDVEGALDEALDAAQAAQAAADAIDDHSHSNKAVLDATTASFLIADESKLDGIEASADVTDATNVAAAGATMDADTDLSANGYFLDEDNMASDSATKVASQQSIKAYADLMLPLAGGTMSGAIAMGSSKITGLLAGTAGTDAVNKTQLDSVSSLLAGWEWQNSVLDYVDNTAAPDTEVSGDRYLLDDTGASHADWDGAAALSIVEFNGTSWVELAPSTGMIVSVDDETNSLRQYSGAAWVQKYFESTSASTGLTMSSFDVQLADASENASGIKVLNGAITLEDLGAFDTDNLSEGTALYFTEARVLGTDLAGFSSGAGSITAADTILSAINKLDGNIAAISDTDDQTAAEVAYTQAVTGDWTAAQGTSVKVALDELGAARTVNEAAISGKQDAAATLDEANTFFGSTDLSAAEAETLSDGSNADSLHKHEKLYKTLTNNTGGQLDAGSIVILSQTVAGEIVLADASALSSCEGVVGVVLANIADAASGLVQIAGEATVSQTAAFDLGKRVYVSETAGEGIKTAPTANDTVVFCMGSASDTAKVVLQPYLVGIN